MLYVIGLHVLGLRSPDSATSTSPILWTTGDLSSIPGGLPAFTVLPRLEAAGLPTSALTTNPRKTFDRLLSANLQIIDTSTTGALGPLLLWTPKAQTWDLDDVRVEASATSLSIAGKAASAPTVNQIVWLAQEAVQVTAVVAKTLGVISSVTSYTLTVTRAVCGSVARLHRLDPAAYSAGDDGSEDRLVLGSRPNFSAYRFDAELYLFQVNHLGAVSSSYLRRFCHVEGVRPLGGRRFEVAIKDAAGALTDHPLSYAGRTIKATHRVVPTEIVNLTEVHSTTATDEGRLIPRRAHLYLTRYEAERYFREPLHKAGTGDLDSTLVSDLNTRLKAHPTVEYHVRLEAAGVWIMRIVDVSLQTVVVSAVSAATERLVRLVLEYVDSEPGASLVELSDQEAA